MSRSKILAMTALVFFVSGIAMIGSAIAGEKFTLHGVSFGTSWKQAEVGDVEGHVLAISESKALFIDNKTGGKSLGTETNFLDINLKTGRGTLKGYGIEIYPNGDKIMRMHEGKPVGKAHWKGTWTITKGTGKYEGAKGGGTWDSYSMGQGQPSYVDVEGEMEMPGQ
jgi:hypothetical protein